MNVTRKVEPSLPVVDLADLKVQCRIEPDVVDEDGVLAAYERAAVQWVEQHTGRSLMSQTWQLSRREFWPRLRYYDTHPSVSLHRSITRLWLPYAAPLQSVTFVKYYDTTNTLQTLSSSVYSVPAFTEPACVVLVDGQSWPSLFPRDDAVQIEYVTGATDPSAVPPSLRQAVQLLAGHWYMNREAISVSGANAIEIPMTVTDLCSHFRLFDRNTDWIDA